MAVGPTEVNEREQVDQRTEPVPRRSRRFTANKVAPYVFILPGVSFVLLVLAYPTIKALWMSLTKTNIFTGETRFVGLEGYVEMFASEGFRGALWQSIVLVTGTVFFGILVATIVAMTLHHVPWGGRMWRTIVLIPWLISGVAVATIWRMLFSPRGGGVPDMILAALGLDQVIWLADPTWAMVVIILISIWSASPFATLIIYSGLKTIDPDFYEAGALDGASALKQFWYITVPSIAPQFSLALIWISFGAFNSFDTILLATGGGPGRSTEVLAVLLYRLGFQELDFHASATVAIVLLGINLILSIVYLRILPKRD